MVNGLLLFSLTTALIDVEREEEYYKAKLPGALNVLLAEVRRYNNSLRVMEGKSAIESYPLITDNEQEIDIEDYVARAILPYGIASVLIMADNPSKATVYRNFFSYKLSVPTYAKAVLVSDTFRRGEA